MASVIIHGFKNEEAAKEFIQWYEGQGEQDIDVWLECRDDVDFGNTNVNCRKTYPIKQDEHGNFVMHLEG